MHLLSAWRLRQLAHGVRADNLETTFREVMRAVHFVPEARIAALLREAGVGEAHRFYGALLFGGWISRKT